ncbi:MAG TPA: translocation/assembly module TamB domain-containing protein [Chitinophagaceae bacterium]|nr:translocation/assembly module TamB domain-containing protein [Chitinophagaceae bacterium]
MWFFLSLLFLIVALYILIQTPFGQNWIAKQVTKRLSRDLQTKVNIKHVDFALFNRMHLEGVLIEDRDRDTLLYAGQVRVRITDWFFLKDKATLQYIGLENAVIKFQRSDSVWRQQFFFDYFASPKTGTKKKEAGIEFDLKEVELTNVVFLKKDGWLGQDMTIHTGAMTMNANELSLSGNQYDIKSLYLREPIVSLYNYPGRKPRDTLTNIPEILLPEQVNKTDSILFWNPGGMTLKIADLKIENGRFRSDKKTEREPFAYFDGQHIDFTEINAEISNASFVGDTIFSKLILSAKERSGLEVKNISADMKIMPQGMAFENLDLQTNRSTIKNYFLMSYNDMSDMGDFIHKVRMAANFDGSYIDSDDIAFFAPGMRSWKKKITLNGIVRGTVDDIVGRDMVIQAGSSTMLDGDISLTGLPDIEQTFIDFKANEFKTTYADAFVIVPALRKITNPDLRKLQYLHFTGSFTGFIRDFVTYGTLRTNLGVVKSDLNMKLPRGQQPVYSGSISTDNFNLGSFLDDPQLGYISMEGIVKGRGFTASNRHAEISGNIRYVDFRDYRYRNIVINKSRLDEEQFDGSLSINDENAELTLSGLIDFNKTTPVFKFVADVKKANLRELKLTTDNLAFNGKFNLDFTGANIDDFLGTARLSDASFTKDGNRLPFDSLTLSSAFIDNQKILTAKSNEFEATIRGQFNIKDLPASFQLFLNKYYPAYIRPPLRRPVNQSLSFDITTQYVEDYIKLIDSSLTGFNYSHISGNLDMRSSTLNMEATIPYFKYKRYDFNDVKLTATGTLDSITLVGETKNIFLNDSLSIPQANFRISGSNDVSRVNITASASQAVDKTNFNAVVTTYNDGVKIDFDPSDFVINGKTWTVDENGELQFRRNTSASGQLVLREGEQVISLRTVPSARGKWNDLLVDLTKLNLGDFSPFLTPHNRLEGLVSGNIKMEDPTGDFRISSDNIQTQFLRIDNDSLGELKASAVYDNRTKELSINGNTLNQENYIEFNARLNLGSREQQRNNIIALKPRNYPLKILERFLGSLFSDIEGYLTGELDLKGEFRNLDVVGKGRLKDAGLKINFTQCFYEIEDTDIELKPTEISLDGIVLRDPVTGNPIYLNGGIQHNSFKNMFYDVRVSTRKPRTNDPGNNRPVLLLNTTYKDNQQFYGNVKGTGSFTLTGPQSDMFMAISAIASDQDSSTITIPPSQSRESGIADFLVERKYGREMSDSAFISSASNITYDLDVTANPMVNVKVVLDELTADEIKGRGRGTLNIQSGTNEPLRIRGRYDIEEGSYLFTFQSVFKKPFELKQGLNADNYIEWTGDPYSARINLEAQYTAERVNYAPLAVLPGVNPNITRGRSDVYVVARLTGELFRPTINFDLQFPPTSPATTDPALAFSLQQLEQNKNEMYKQVTYLIVFNSFAPAEGSSAGGLGLDIRDIATNTISGIFLGVINDQLNKIFNRLLKNDKYTINLNTTLYNRNIIDPNNKTAFNLGSNVNFSIGRSFFNDRFIITAGGGFDAPLQQSNIQQSIQLLPDVTMEWLINPSGTLRVSFFYRQNADYLTTTANGGPGRATRYGGSLTYKKEFEKLSDLFRRRKPRPVTDTTTSALPPVANKNEEESGGKIKDENE